MSILRTAGVRPTVLLGCVLALWVGSSPAAELEDAEDREWVTVSGRISAIAEGKLRLAYEGGEILIEVDDADATDELARLKAGDLVTIGGTVDERLGELRAIEAGTIFDHGRNTVYYVSAADEESDFSSYHYMPDPSEHDTHVTLTGTVQKVNGSVITMDTGLGMTTVHVEAADGEARGRTPLEPGDRVSVRGVLDNDLFEKDTLTATSIITLRDSNRNGQVY